MIIFVTVPFKGHYNVILRSAEEFAKKGKKVRLIILTWSNFPVDMPQNPLLHTTVLTSKVPITSSKPTEFTWDRTTDLTDELYKLCLKWHTYDVIDWMIYDFFCPEALIVSEALRIPSVCSIPAIFPPSSLDSDTAYHKEATVLLKPVLDTMSAKWHLNPPLSERLTPVSDSFYISGSQKQWLWAHPSLFDGMSLPPSFSNPVFVTRNLPNPVTPVFPVTPVTPVTPVVLEAPAAPAAPVTPAVPVDQVTVDTVYVCLGTVVTGNLWKKNAEARNLAQLIYSTIIDWVLERNIKAIICTPGLDRVDLGSNIVRLCEANADQIQLVKEVDQVMILNCKSTKLFITHGGGNSVSEAIDAGTRMIVVPFFGDQHISAELVEKAGFGLNFKHERLELAIDTICPIHDKRIDSRKTFRELLEKSWDNISSLNGSNRTSKISHNCFSIKDIELPRNAVHFRSGDLLFGANVARLRFKTSAPTYEFDIGDMRPPSTRLPRLPALIDHYNDVLRLKDSSPIRIRELKENKDSEYGLRFHALENYYRNKHFVPNCGHAYPPTDLDGLWNACCGGLAYFLLERKDTFIHFVLHPEYDSNINRATTLELRWIREHYEEVRDRVRFYWYLPTTLATVNQVDGLEACNPLALNWFEWRLDEIEKYLKGRNLAETDIITDHLPLLKQGRGTIYVEKRLKTAQSLYEKIKIRGKREGIVDSVGVRFIHLSTNQLSFIGDQLIDKVHTCSEFTTRKCVAPAVGEATRRATCQIKRFSERGRIIHLFFWFPSDPSIRPIEVQLWPIVLHTCFESEHDTVYKPKTTLTQDQIVASDELREQEHILQALIDDKVSAFLFLKRT